MWCLRCCPVAFPPRHVSRVDRSSFGITSRNASLFPLLHNALLFLFAIFSDDPRIRDPNSRGYSMKAATACDKDERKRPNIISWKLLRAWGRTLRIRASGLRQTCITECVVLSDWVSTSKHG